MSISLRTRRVLIGSYRDAGDQSSGDPASEYVRQSSGTADHSWWCSITLPTGKEVTTGMKAEHRVDAVLGFGPAAPVTENGAIRISGVDYLVRAILPRDYGRDELQVLVERAAASLDWVNA